MIHQEKPEKADNSLYSIPDSAFEWFLLGTYLILGTKGKTTQTYID